MRVLWALAFIVMLSPALRAQAPSPEPAPIPNPSQPPPASPNAPSSTPAPNSTASASPSAHMMRAWRRLNYTCDNNAKVVVNLHGTDARVIFQGHTYDMKEVDQEKDKPSSPNASASTSADATPAGTQPGAPSNGDKYTDGSVIWRVKGEDGSLEHAPKSKSAESKKLATACHLQSSGPAPSTPPAKTPPSTPK